MDDRYDAPATADEVISSLNNLIRPRRKPTEEQRAQAIRLRRELNDYTDPLVELGIMKNGLSSGVNMTDNSASIIAYTERDPVKPSQVTVRRDSYHPAILAHELRHVGYYAIDENMSDDEYNKIYTEIGEDGYVPDEEALIETMDDMRNERPTGASWWARTFLGEPAVVNQAANSEVWQRVYDNELLRDAYGFASPENVFHKLLGDYTERYRNDDYEVVKERDPIMRERVNSIMDIARRYPGMGM